MAEVITMLALSPTMEEGTLVEWLKSEGDSVEEGELIAEIETDKATMEMESFHDGVLLKLIAKKGDALAVGAPLAVVGKKGEDISDLLAGLGQKGSSAPAQETKPETKAVEEQAPKAEAKPEKTAPRPESDDSDRIKASPVARKMAKEKGLDLATLEGSGPHGRIIMKDVEEASAPSPSRAAQGTAESSSNMVALSQMRKTIARRLVEVWNDTPHFYLTADIDMAKAMAQRAEINAQLKAAGSVVKISVNDLIVKASAVALRNYPKMNVAFRGDSIEQYDDVHVGVAVAIPDGLITPVIRDADQKTLSQVATEIRELATRAKDKRLKPHEYTGSTFSISNLGMYQIDEFSAIINPPEAAILACGSVRQTPVVEDGEIVVGTRMKITLSCDHRAVDGAVGAEFLMELRRLLENPILLLV